MHPEDTSFSEKIERNYYIEIHVSIIKKSPNVQVQKIFILPPEKGLEFPGSGGGGFLQEDFQRGARGVVEKNPSFKEVWIFSGTTPKTF